MLSRMMLVTMILLCLAGAALAQSSFYSEKALAPESVLGIPQPVASPIPYANVRVCTLPLTQNFPCLPLASISDQNGNAISNAIGSNFGQLFGDVTGFFIFGCTVNTNYRVQIQQSASNSPVIDHSASCPGFGNNLGSPLTLNGPVTINNNLTVSGTGTVGSLNGHLVLDGVKFAQTEAGFNAALIAVGASGTIEIPPGVLVPVASGININKVITVLCSQNQINDASPTTPGGFSGTGITMVTMSVSGAAIKGCNFDDFTGNASTVGLSIGLVANWTVEDCNFVGNLSLGAGNFLGVGMKLTGSLKGRVFKNNFLGWNHDIDISNSTTSNKANSNQFIANVIRTGNIGMQFNADSVDDTNIQGGTIENNGTGINAATFTIASFIEVCFVHFENIQTPKVNINLGTGPLGIYSCGNRYNGAATNTDLIVGAGNTADMMSIGDEFNSGITHNGTGGLAVYSTTLSSSVPHTGTGPIDFFNTHGSAGLGIAGINRSGQNYQISGYNLLDVREAIYNLGGITTIGASTGNSVQLVDHNGVSRLTADDASGQVRIATTLGNTAATATMGLTLKQGSGAGNYTNATTSYTVADSTNLCLTVTIPTGWKLGISASGALSTATAAVVAQAALTDNASCSTANAGILVETAPIQGAAIGVADAFALNWVIAGNGAAHNIALQFKTSNAADTASLINSSATITPTMKFELMPSN